MSEEFHQSVMFHMVEEAFDVCLYEPLSLIQRDDVAQPYEGLVGIAPRAETVGPISVLRFPNCLQDVAPEVLKHNP